MCNLQDTVENLSTVKMLPNFTQEEATKPWETDNFRPDWKVDLRCIIFFKKMVSELGSINSLENRSFLCCLNYEDNRERQKYPNCI